MSEHVFQHDMSGEPERLRLMSALLDPTSEFHLLRLGIAPGWRCLEIGAGNGSLSQWLARRVGANGHVVASDIRTDLMQGMGGSNLKVRELDVVHDEPPDPPYDLVVVRAVLHHLPERRAVASKMARWVKPGGSLLVQEPDFYPASTVEPPSQKHFWEQFTRWAATRQIDYYVGRKIPAWLQAEGLVNINCQAHATLYNGGSEFSAWWELGIRAVADKLQSEGGVSPATLDELFRLYRNPTYWTTTIAFLATTAQRPLL
jgi:SAM-dependent methyltransferase